MPGFNSKNISGMGTFLLFAMAAALPAIMLAEQLGMIGMNLGVIEPLVWIGVGLFVLVESVGENKKQLMKGSILVGVEALVGLLWIVYGGALAGEATNIVAAISPYKTFLLAGGLVFAVLESFTKL